MDAFAQVEAVARRGAGWFRLGIETPGAPVIGAGAVVALVGLPRHLSTTRTSRSPDEPPFPAAVLEVS